MWLLYLWFRSFFVPQEQAKVGQAYKCWIYRGTQSWWLYIQVIGVIGDDVITSSLSKTCYGEVVYLPKGNGGFYKNPIPWCYLRISDAEYQEALRKIV